MKIFLTGASGFIGTRLQERLLASGGFEIESLESADILDFEAVSRQIVASPAECFVHLAGISDVATCENDPKLAHGVNMYGVAMLLEALIKRKRRAHVIFASTAHVYDFRQLKVGLAIGENFTTQPVNVYGRTKLGGEGLLHTFCEGHSLLSASVLRLFNFTHKSQSARFFLPAIHEQILSAKDSSLTLKVGNLDLARDIGSVRELIDAFQLEIAAAATALPGTCSVFNVATGSTKTLRGLAEKLAAKLGKKVSFQTDPSKVRTDDPPSILGDSSRFQKARGWQPRATSEEQLVDLFLSDEG